MKRAFNFRRYMRSLIALLTLAFLVSCSTHSNSYSVSAPGTNGPREYQTGAFLWVQTSGEYRALLYQAYNIAKERVERDLEDKHNRTRAVIFDIDETILDNSVGGARDIKSGEPWKKSDFSYWVKLKQATAMPAALEFIKFLEERQVAVFYITNRSEELFNETYENLVAQGFPVKKENLMLMGKDHSKEARRQEVLKNHNIVLLLGDNLSDFSKAFEKKNIAERYKAVDGNRTAFGQKFIILPNPMYGDWERALPMDKSRTELLKINP